MQEISDVQDREQHVSNFKYILVKHKRNLLISCLQWTYDPTLFTWGYYLHTSHHFQTVLQCLEWLTITSNYLGGGRGADFRERIFFFGNPLNEFFFVGGGAKLTEETFFYNMVLQGNDPLLNFVYCAHHCFSLPPDFFPATPKKFFLPFCTTPPR